MSENLSATELSESWDITKGFQKVERNNLGLAEQIQFSQILRVMVAPPEKVLADARGPAKPLEKPSEPKAAEPGRDPLSDLLDRTPSDIKDFARSDPKDMETASRPAPRDAEPVAEAEPAHKPPAQPLNDDTNNTQLPAEAAFQAVAAVQGDRNAPRPTPRPAPVIQVAAAQPIAAAPLGTRAAIDNLTSALTSRNFTDIADDLYTASSAKTKGAPVISGSPSAANALSARQASALSRKIGANAEALINVTVKTTGGKIKSVPSQTLAPGALLAGNGLEGENTLSLTGQANSNGANAERQGHGVSTTKPATPAWGQNISQDNVANFGQAVRAQAAAISAQQAANAANMGIKAQPVSIDSAQLNPLSGPTGPNQLNQVAKAAPPPPPRPLPQPKAPMEQIAVNIQKAFGAGADKINIRLNPASLGSVNVKLEIGKDGHISAMITAERPETLDLLQRDARGLERALQDVGLQTDKESLNFSLRGENQAEAGKNKKTDNHAATPSEENDQDDELEHQDGNLTDNSSRPGPTDDGRVDIKV